MIYTSYYGALRNLDINQYQLISISNSIPKGINYEIMKLSLLVPDWDLVNRYKLGKISEEEYEVNYVQQLNSHKKSILKLIDGISNSNKKDTLLLCWESPDKFCHRHIFSKWINGLVGEEVIKEFDFRL